MNTDVDPQTKQPDSNQFSVSIDLAEDSVILDNKDVLQCYFIEDIFSYCIVGKLIFADPYGFLEIGPFTGNETITINYGNEDEMEKTFDIFRVSKISGTADVEPTSRASVEIYFVERAFKMLNKYRYSLSWGVNVLISDIINHIAVNMLDVSDFEQYEATRETISNFYMPYWTPREAIGWLIRRATGSYTQKPGYLYYNNSKGVNFVTLEKLLRQEQPLTIGGEDKGHYVFDDSGLYYQNKILSWEISGIDNQSLNRLEGGHKLGYDFQTKTLIDRSFQYSTSVSKFTMLGRKTLFEDISNTHGEYTLEGDSEAVTLDNIYYSDFIKRYCMQQCLIINLRGSERRYAGAMIEIDWPSSVNDVYNKNMEGRYLIKSIINSFMPDKQPGYLQKMILIKNAYSDSENTNLVNSTLKNVLVRRHIGTG